ncbi:MAG: hypothetical protein EOP51_12505 [Sphingobacteriales bacterium]|nr:MAG: hypothetical protein EOP51_12505 [Sphingobacteriales bacterium]
MRTSLRFLAVLIFVGATATALGYFVWYKPKFKGDSLNFKIKYNSAGKPVTEKYKLPLEKLGNVSSQLKSYAAKNNYNNTIAFLIDMAEPSGRKRFFVYNMQKDSIELAGLVTHGYGSNKEGIEFSNVPGSFCTSLGKYKIGNAYNGRFGLAFKLHGLDKTNDKAFERFVVLHAHSCVPVDEIAPLPICESQGCPTVAPAFLQELKKYIEASDKPILLHIYQ